MKKTCAICGDLATRICGKCRLTFCDRHRCLCNQGKARPLIFNPDIYHPRPSKPQPYWMQETEDKIGTKA